MTQSGANRVLPLLAASGLTSSEVREFLLWVKETPLQDATRAFSRARNQIRHLDIDSTDEADQADSLEVRRSSSVFRDVQKLLEDTNYTVPEAVRRISQRLEETHPTLGFPEGSFSAKDGLRRWVTRVANKYGDSAVLTAAVDALSTRSKFKSDWPLG